VVGERASCGIDVGDALFCWGDDPGRLGLADDTRDTTVPQRVTGTGSTTLFRRVAIGAGHGCAPRFSDPPNVYCFGRNDYGQSGGTPGDTLVAPAASVMLGSAFAIATGDRHTCVARTTSPAVVCWGHNDYGQLAVPSSTVDMTGMPRSASIRAYSLAAGASFTCVLRDPDSRPVCWGDNRGSQCGAAPTREVGRTVVPLDDAVVPQGLDAGDSHACIVAEDGSVWCWGSNAAGQLGLGMDAGPTTPTPMRALGDGYVDVRAAADRTCARRSDGSLWCWGRGNGTPTPVCVE
jgi:alpha-tubulin suppressor-like RCC1 family protein